MISAKRNLLILLGVIVLLISQVFDPDCKAAELVNNPVASSAEMIQPLLIGDKTPNLILKAYDGSDFDLNAAIDEKPAIVVFYQGGWSYECTTQLGRLLQTKDQFEGLGYQIIAISPDKPQKIRQLINTYDYSFTLLSDSKKTATKAFGIAFKLSDALNEEYKGKGIYIENASGETDHVLPVPSVFIITKNGIIRFEYINPDQMVRIDTDILVEIAKAIKEKRM